jgi:hypothetical protein
MLGRLTLWGPLLFVRSGNGLWLVLQPISFLLRYQTRIRIRPVGAALRQGN